MRGVLHLGRVSEGQHPRRHSPVLRIVRSGNDASVGIPAPMVHKDQRAATIIAAVAVCVHIAVHIPRRGPVVEEMKVLELFDGSTHPNVAIPIKFEANPQEDKSKYKNPAMPLVKMFSLERNRQKNVIPIN